MGGNMLPTRMEAERLLEEAEKYNPGPWGNHSRVAAHCAEKIALGCEGMNPEKAYILGLLHDIGRKFGVSYLKHVSDGYSYMMSLGYDEVARVCLTHSFNNMRVDEYVGKVDTSDEEYELIQTELGKLSADDYDRLIQLCDALAGSNVYGCKFRVYLSLQLFFYIMINSKKNLCAPACKDTYDNSLLMYVIVHERSSELLLLCV